MVNSKIITNEGIATVSEYNPDPFLSKENGTDIIFDVDLYLERFDILTDSIQNLITDVEIMYLETKNEYDICNIELKGKSWSKISLNHTTNGIDSIFFYLYNAFSNELSNFLLLEGLLYQSGVTSRIDLRTKVRKIHTHILYPMVQRLVNSQINII